jgi:hypothetical protein
MNSVTPQDGVVACRREDVLRALATAVFWKAATERFYKAYLNVQAIKARARDAGRNFKRWFKQASDQQVFSSERCF